MMRIISKVINHNLDFFLTFFIDLKTNENEEKINVVLSLEMGEASIAKKLTKLYDRKMNMKKSTFYSKVSLRYSDDDCSSTDEDEDTKLTSDKTLN